MTDILIHQEAGISTITFNRVDKKNSLTAAMYACLADTLEAAATDDATRVVVFQGHETIFSAGNDIADFLNTPPTAADAPVFRFLRAISTFPKPLVAAVCGPAVGIGTTLLFHCDLVYAGDNAAFSMPFVNLGLCPEAGSWRRSGRMSFRVIHSTTSSWMIFSTGSTMLISSLARCLPCFPCWPRSLHASACLDFLR